ATQLSKNVRNCSLRCCFTGCGYGILFLLRISCSKQEASVRYVGSKKKESLCSLGSRSRDNRSEKASDEDGKSRESFFVQSVPQSDSKVDFPG
uniref:Uncharacterized protein n=1 Tax=Ditylenchus dipsaci TaxID=166011 RepID=A0A915DY70_9BILA